MKGSGCKTCPFVHGCFAQYRGSACKAVRAERGLGDPMTNADRIRAMTDEELAEFLDKCEARGYQDSSIARDASDHCIDMLDWLQQPVKEGAE